MSASGGSPSSSSGLKWLAVVTLAVAVGLVLLIFRAPHAASQAQQAMAAPRSILDRPIAARPGRRPALTRAAAPAPTEEPSADVSSDALSAEQLAAVVAAQQETERQRQLRRMALAAASRSLHQPPPLPAQSQFLDELARVLNQVHGDSQQETQQPSQRDAVAAEAKAKVEASAPSQHREPQPQPPQPPPHADQHSNAKELVQHGLDVAARAVQARAAAEAAVQSAKAEEAADEATLSQYVPRRAHSGPISPAVLQVVPQLLTAPAAIEPGTGARVYPDPCARLNFTATPEQRQTLTFVLSNPRTGSFFLSERFSRFRTGRYRYVVKFARKELVRPFESAENWVEWACHLNPGPKVVVWDFGANLLNVLLRLWPAGTVFILTGDESGHWGIYDNKRFWGPFGQPEADKDLFDYTKDHPLKPIILPQKVVPWFRQYETPMQRDAFGNRTAFYFPLGSRQEFPDLFDKEPVPPSQRKYVLSLMISITDVSRRQLADVLGKTTLIPKDKMFMHVSNQWHAEVTNEAYVPPNQYADIMQQSIFAPCPKGHSLETFRFYEAIEAGAIPVINTNNGAARRYFPHFDSPMVTVDDWEQLPQVLADLLKDMQALNARQKAMRVWYTAYLKGLAEHVEKVAEDHWNLRG